HGVESGGRCRLSKHAAFHAALQRDRTTGPHLADRIDCRWPAGSDPAHRSTVRRSNPVSRRRSDRGNAWSLGAASALVFAWALLLLKPDAHLDPADRASLSPSRARAKMFGRTGKAVLQGIQGNDR